MYLIYLCMNNKMTLFAGLCCKGNLDNIKKYYSEHPNINIHIEHELVFRHVCASGKLKVAQWLFEISTAHEEKIGLINIHAHGEDAFIMCCKHGHIELAKWLIQLSKENKNVGFINIHARGDAAFVECCRAGRIDMAKWLIELSGGNITDCFNMNILKYHAFVICCTHAHFDMVKWLLLELIQNTNTDMSSICDMCSEAFSMSCMVGQLTIAQWLYEISLSYIGVIDIHRNNDYAFRSSILNGKFDVVKWLVFISSNGISVPINIHSGNEYAFRMCCENGYLDIAKWLVEKSYNDDEGMIAIHKENNYAFIHCCLRGHLELAKWLAELSKHTKTKLLRIDEFEQLVFSWNINHEYPNMSCYLYSLYKNKFSIYSINKAYQNIKCNKSLIKYICADYGKNNFLREEYKRDYYKWKVKIIFRLVYHLIHFYNYVLKKSYSPTEISEGFLRTKNDFNNKLRLH